MPNPWLRVFMLAGAMAGLVAMAWNAGPSLMHYNETSLVLPATVKNPSGPWTYGIGETPHYTVQVHIEAGDTSVPNASLQQARRLITSVSLKVVAQNIGGLPLRPTDVLLYGSSAGYIGAVSSVFPQSEATNAAGQTAGFTYQSNVVIPLYVYANPAYLANTLTHELTHVTLNQEELGMELPTWVNEGFAWYNGMEAEQRIDPASEQQLYQLLLNGINVARQQGELLPLTVGEGVVLHNNAQYNLEFFDYLAIKQLIATYGIDQFQRFLKNIHGEGVAASFERTFGISMRTYETNFYRGFQGV